MRSKVSIISSEPLELSDSELSTAPTRSSSHAARLETIADAKGQMIPDMLLEKLSVLNSVSPCIECMRPNSGSSSASTSKLPDDEERKDCHALFWLCCSLHSSNPLSQSLDWAGFQLAFGASHNAPLIKRMFDLINRRSEGLLSAEDFILGLFPLYSPRASIEIKLSFLFSCFDLDGSGSVSREDLLVALCGSLQQHCSLSPTQLEQVIGHTFAEMDADADGEISWQDFSSYFKSHPSSLHSMLRMVEFNVNRVTAELWLSMDEGWLQPRGGPPAPADTLLE
mmetsp:Transcript_16545/g.27508  ORF Transcript_16545/g.27508 Transcript_16545/m.27508 type:complete len:282 (+) Transcript_16545:147-992(+)